MLPVAILAGGLATRLRPTTETIPKSLIEIAGKPFICHQINYLRKQGVHSIVICVGFLGKMIEEVVGNGSQWGISIVYSHDGEYLLGTGGAVRNALPLLAEHFFILYGDSYLPINFRIVQQAFLTSGKKGLLTILKNRNEWDKSNVEFSAGQIIEYNKLVVRSQMHYIDYGLGLIQASVLDQYPTSQAFDLANIYNELSVAKELAGFEVFERFYEIGSHQGIADTKTYLMQEIEKGSI